MNFFIKQLLIISVLTKLSSAVIYGNTTGREEFPWMALIEYTNPDDNKKSFNCAGSLINDRYVVTSGVCAKNDFDLSGVRLGVWDKTTNPDCIIGKSGKSDCADGYIDVPVEEIILHPSYNVENNQNDIAILRLKQSVTFSPTIKPIALPTNGEQRDNMYDNRKMEIAGWGVTQFGTHFGSDKKQKATVTVRNLEKCKENYSNWDLKLTTSQICAIGDDGSDACTGDSGGPLMVSERLDKQEQYYLIGIISSGRGCGVVEVPGIYTRIGAYIDWINQTIEQ